MEKKEKIGTFRIMFDMKRIKTAFCPKYDEWVDVKAGDYPVYAKDIDELGRVKMAYVTFDGWCEVWYGFLLAKCETFTPADGWKVNRWTFKSDWDGHDIDTGEIVRENK